MLTCMITAFPGPDTKFTVPTWLVLMHAGMKGGMHREVGADQTAVQHSGTLPSLV